jgi:hypothetical protein
MLVLGAAAALAVLAGCGSDSSGDTTAATPSSTEVSIPPPTSPIPTTTAATTTTASGGGKKKPPQTTTSATGGSGPCSVPDAYQDFKYTGIDCTAAVGVATAWDQNGKDCNTIDNPNSPDGYKRTCSVEGFTCTAKRDVHSDARFVTCTQGGQSIRFTWLPA